MKPIPPQIQRIIIRAASGLPIVALWINCVQAQTPPGLVSWWRGDGNVLDSVGTNNGSINGPQVSFPAGHSGQGFNFSSGIVRIPDAPSLDPRTNLTVQFWLRCASPGTYRYVVNKVCADGNVSYAFYSGWEESPGQPGLWFWGNITQAPWNFWSPSAGGALVWDGNWHQITGTFDGDTARIYVDGVERGAPSSTPGEIFYGSSGPLYFGEYGANPIMPGTSLNFKGDLDEVKVFDRVMTAAEVMDTYTNSASTTATNGLAGWWRGEGNALDSWGTNHGMFTTFSYGTGKSGQSLFPQGVTALVPDSLSLQPSNFTMQVWVKSALPGTYKYIFSKNGPYQLYTAANGGLAAWGGTFGAVSIPPQRVWDGAWHQATLTFDTVTARLFVDGLEQANSPATGPLDFTNNAPLIFGDYGAARGTIAYFGELDDVQLFNRALSAQEVLSTYLGSSLVGWWLAGTNADDTAGTNHGVLAGSAFYVPGRAASTACNTTGGSVQVADSAQLRPANLTLEAVVSGYAPGANKYIISKSRTSASASYAFATGPGGGLVFSVTTAGGSVASAAAPSTLWDGGFHLVDGTYDGAQVRLFVDGREVGGGTAASGAIQYGTAHEGGKLLFGDFYATTGSTNFTGNIGSVKLYNTALSAAEILNHSFTEVEVFQGPQSQAAAPGSDLRMSVFARGSTKPLAYQWMHNGTNIPGATDDQLRLPSFQPSDTGEYKVQVANRTVEFTSGHSGSAFRNNGGVIIVPRNTNLEPQNFTLQTWVRSSTPPGAYRYIIAKSRLQNLLPSYALYTGGSGGIGAYVVISPDTSGNSVPEILPEEVWDGNWHQITLTWDGQYLSIFKDGAFAGWYDTYGATIDYSFASAGGDLNGDLIFGDFTEQLMENHWSGDLDDVKLFNYAMTWDNVLDTYNNPGGTTSTNNLISWWKADGNYLDSVGANHAYPSPDAGWALSSAATLALPAPATLSSARVAGGSFQATVTGPAGVLYRIERASSLSAGSWTPLVTNTVPFTFTDAVGGAAAFYRGVRQ